MKYIEPIQIWSQGQTKTASVLDARIINDDLESSCVFYWELKEADTQVTSSVSGSEEPSIVYGSRLSEGNSTIQGEEYINWDGSNDYAYQFIATQLNVTLITGSNPQ